MKELDYLIRKIIIAIVIGFILFIFAFIYAWDCSGFLCSFSLILYTGTAILTVFGGIFILAVILKMLAATILKEKPKKLATGLKIIWWLYVICTLGFGIVALYYFIPAFFEDFYGEPFEYYISMVGYLMLMAMGAREVYKKYISA